jgi:hypothetical protein
MDHEIVKATLTRLLKSREPPKTICPSEAARSLPLEELDKLGGDWRLSMPLVREILFDMRDAGLVEILQKGIVLPNDIQLDHIKGPIRARCIMN